MLWLSFDTSSDSPDDLADYSENKLWRSLPRKFREELGDAGGTLPRDEILALLVETRADLGKLMGQFSGLVDSVEHQVACDCFAELQRRARSRATWAFKRRAGLDPALQQLRVMQKVAHRALPDPGCRTLWPSAGAT